MTGVQTCALPIYIPYDYHRARQIKKEDYEKYDFIIGMEDDNLLAIKRIVGEDKERKIYKLLYFSPNVRDIADPWYTGNFDKTYDDVLEGCTLLLEHIKKIYNI